VAHCRFKNEAYRICVTAPVDDAAEGAPGVVLRAERDHLVVATGQGALALMEVQPPGKRAMAVSEYLRGHAVAPGDRFEDL
jgi:methionyl-tRNA formyltransferase